MSWILVGVATVWIGANVVIAIVLLTAWLSGRKGEKRGPKPAAVEVRMAPDPTPEVARDLAPDPGLLVPWSAVRSDMHRLGVAPKDLRAGIEDPAPPPSSEATPATSEATRDPATAPGNTVVFTRRAGRRRKRVAGS